MTRIDTAFDNVPFTPAMCKEAYDLGCFRTKANRNSGDWRSNKQGDTFYLGSRSSPRYLRIYNRRGPTRCEMQYKEQYAAELAKNLAEVSELKLMALDYLRDFVEFTILPVDRKNSSRIAVSHWWESFVACADKLTLNRKHADERFVAEKTMRYFKRLLPSLCLFVYGLGIDINRAVADYKCNLEPKHLAKISKLQNGHSS